MKSLVLKSSFLEALSELFHPDMSNYKYINGESVRIIPIIMGIFIGFCIACVMVVFDKRVLGDFVRQLLSEECLSKDRAMTLSELGYLKNPIIRGALKSNVSIRRVVKCVEEEAFYEDVERLRAEYEAANAGKRALPFKSPRFRFDASTMHFYIPEEMKYTADVKFEKKGTNPVTLLLGILVFAALALVALFLLPDLLQMVDNAIGMFDQKNNILT